MKKMIKTVIALLLILVLAACGNQANQDNDGSTIKTFPSTNEEDTEDNVSEDEAIESGIEDDNTEDEAADSGTDNENTEDNQEIDSNKVKDDNPSAANIDIIDFEEATVIEDEIDVSELTVKVETDNRNNRVILFFDGDELLYKTIFVKRDNRLKIIDIKHDDGQIFNNII